MKNELSNIYYHAENQIYYTFDSITNPPFNKINMKKLHEIIKHAEELIEDFAKCETFIKFDNVNRYARSIKTYFTERESAPIFVFTDSYGSHGFIVLEHEYSEAIQEYVDSLEPANEEERQAYAEQANAAAQYITETI